MSQRKWSISWSLATIAFIATLVLWPRVAPSDPSWSSTSVPSEVLAGSGHSTAVDPTHQLDRTKPMASQPEVSAASPDSQGEVQVLLLPQRLPAAGLRVSCRSDGAARSVVTDANGTAVLPVGQWTFESPGVVFSERELQVEQTAMAILWACGTADVSMSVVDGTGQPIAGVSICWACDGSGWRKGEWAGEVKTDENGEATLRAAATCALRLRISAPGFEPQVFSEWSPERKMRVVLKRDARLARVLVVDALDSRPLPLSTFEFSLGNLEAVSNGDGVFALTPSHLTAPAEEVAVRCPGYAPTWIRLDPRVDLARIGLKPGARIRIAVKRPNIGARIVISHTVDPDADALHFKRQDFARLGAGESYECVLPIGSSALVEAYTNDGEMGARGIERVNNDETVVIETRPSSELRIVCYHDGKPLADRVWASFDVAGSAMKAAGTVDGEVVVPMVDRVDGIVVSVSGMEDVRIYPIDASSNQNNRAGDLRLDLDKPVLYSLHLVDEAGQAVAGAEIRMVNMDRPPLDRFPKLGGRLPTSHPAWSRKPSPTRFALSDSCGRLSLAISRGRWEVRARRSGIAPPFADLWHAVDKTVLISESSHADKIILPNSKILQIEATNSSTGEPISGIRIFGERLIGSGQEMTSTRPIAIVPATSTWLEVAADGYARSRVEIPSHDATIVVSMTPKPAIGILRLVGDTASDLAGCDLQVFVTHDATPDGHVVWSTTVRVDESGSAAVSVGVQEGAIVHVGTTAHFRFQAEQPVWVDGGEVRFRVVRK